MQNEVYSISVHTHSAFYTVQIEPGILTRCGPLVKKLRPVSRMEIVTDSNVAPLYLDALKRSLCDAGIAVSCCVFPAGESHKNFQTLQNILETMASDQLTRRDCVAALGGGVTGDMAGFAASVYMRGIGYIQFPTTLLADVDSSVGGKTAIDLRNGKNLAGSFSQPVAVFCDTECLATLPTPVFADGIAEAVKTGVLCGDDLFSRFEETDFHADDSRQSLNAVLARCIDYKAGIVERDEREHSERRLLNLGHTVGHAIEKCSGYTISHGHAVAAGLGIIARASEALGWAEEPLGERISHCLRKNNLPDNTSYTAEELAQAALSDKKRAGGDITLIVPRRIGRCTLETVPIESLTEIVHAGL